MDLTFFFGGTAALLGFPVALLGRTTAPLITGPQGYGTRLLLEKSLRCGSSRFHALMGHPLLLLIGLTFLGNGSSCLRLPRFVLMAISSPYNTKVLLGFLARFLQTAVQDQLEFDFFLTTHHQLWRRWLDASVLAI